MTEEAKQAAQRFAESIKATVVFPILNRPYRPTWDEPNIRETLDYARAELDTEF